MKRSEYNNWQKMAALGEVSDDLNPAFILSLCPSALLADVVAGKYDLNELAKRELENRGQDASGRWVGFGHPIK